MAIVLTLGQAFDLVRQSKRAAAGDGRLLDIIMPNGKRFGDRTFEYVGEVGEAMKQFASLGDPEGEA